MRVAEITHDESPWSPLVLHPRLNVIFGEASAIDDLEAILNDLYSSAGGAVGGSIEYSGFQMPLDQTAVVSLDLHGRGMRSLDPVDLEDACRAMRAGLVSGSQSRLEDVDTRIAQMGEDLEALRRKRAAAEAALSAVSDELAHSSELIDELIERQEQALVRPEELRREIEQAVNALDVAASTLAEAETVAEEVSERLDPNGSTITALRLGDATSGLVGLVEQADAMGLLDPDTASSLSVWLSEVAAGTAETSSSITEMLDEIQELESRWSELAARGVEGDQEVVDARERQRETAQRTENLEQLVSSGLLAERARQEIDAAHDSSDDEEEARVLSLYGFESYLDYTIAISTRSVGEAIEATVVRARAETVRATDILEAAREEAAKVRHALNLQREALRVRVTSSTGVDPESLSSEALAAIPELPAVLEEVVPRCQVSLERLRDDCNRIESEVTELRRELDAVPDPVEIAAEADSERERMAAFEPLLPQAETIHAETQTALEASEISLEALRTTRAELIAERAVYETASDALGPGDVAVMIHAAVAEILIPDAEPTPVLLADSFAQMGAAACDVLEAVSAEIDRTQLVYLTSDDDLAGWAKHLPADVGKLHRISPKRWLGRRLARPRRRQTRTESR